MDERTKVQVGMMVELTREEWRELAEHSYAMQQLSKKGAVGWLGQWARHHAGAGRVLRRAIERSHASQGPPRVRGLHSEP